MKPIQNRRGSAFVFCLKSETDERFPKYPNLPVLSCPGYEPRSDPSLPPRFARGSGSGQA